MPRAMPPISIPIDMVVVSGLAVMIQGKKVKKSNQPLCVDIRSGVTAGKTSSFYIHKAAGDGGGGGSYCDDIMQE